MLGFYFRGSRCLCAGWLECRELSGVDLPSMDGVLNNARFSGDGGLPVTIYLQRIQKICQSGVMLAVWGMAVHMPVKADLSYADSGGIATVTTLGLTTTGSEWQRCPEGLAMASPYIECIAPVAGGGAKKLTYQEALDAAAAIGGGWRIPTQEYLAATLTSAGGAPRTNTSIFPNTPTDEVFWSSTPPGLFPLSASMRMTVNFANGDQSAIRSISTGDTAYLRLVRPRDADLNSVTVTADGGGNVAGATVHTLQGINKENLIFSLTPDALHHLTEVSVTSGSCVVDELTSLLNKKAFVTVGTDDCAVRAIFTPDANTFEITTSVEPAVGGTLKCPVRAALNDDVDCEATPATGFQLLRLEGCDATAIALGSTVTRCTLRNVTGSRNVKAIYGSGTHSIPVLDIGALLGLSTLVGAVAVWRSRQCPGI